MVYLSAEKLAFLTPIREARARTKSIESALRAEYEVKIAGAVASANHDLDLAMARAAQAGVPARRIGEAYGSSDPHTIKRRISAGMEFLEALPVPASNDLRAYTRWEGDRLYVSGAPAKVWTYDANPDKFRTPDPVDNWEGWLQIVDGDFGEREPLIGNMLQAEWLYGTGLDEYKTKED